MKNDWPFSSTISQFAIDAFCREFLHVREPGATPLFCFLFWLSFLAYDRPIRIAFIAEVLFSGPDFLGSGILWTRGFSLEKLMRISRACHSSSAIHCRVSGAKQLARLYQALPRPLNSLFHSNVNGIVSVRDFYPFGSSETHRRLYAEVLPLL